MRVGVALKLQEAWKAKFETRPSVSSQDISFKSLSKEDQDSSDDGIGLESDPSLTRKATLGTTVGYRDECITVDARKDKKGQWVLVKGDELIDSKQNAKKKAGSILDPYCVVITRRFDNQGKLLETIAEIQSPGLIQLLRSTVKFWPDSTFRVGDTIQCKYNKCGEISRRLSHLLTSDLALKAKILPCFYTTIARNCPNIGMQLRRTNT